MWPQQTPRFRACPEPLSCRPSEQPGHEVPGPLGSPALPQFPRITSLLSCHKPHCNWLLRTIQNNSNQEEMTMVRACSANHSQYQWNSGPSAPRNWSGTCPCVFICVFTSAPMSLHVRWPDFFCFLFYFFEVACCLMSMYIWQTNNVCTHVHLCLCYCNICASVHPCAFLYACSTVVMCAHVCAYASVIISECVHVCDVYAYCVLCTCVPAVLLCTCVLCYSALCTHVMCTHVCACASTHTSLMKGKIPELTLT